MLDLLLQGDFKMERPILRSLVDHREVKDLSSMVDDSEATILIVGRAGCGADIELGDYRAIRTTKQMRKSHPKISPNPGEGVSKTHATLIYRPRDEPVDEQNATLHRPVDERGTFSVVDENSANGTYVNRHRLRPGEVRELNPGDVVSFGLYNMIFTYEQMNGKEGK